MKIVDRLSRILGSRDQETSKPESHVLTPFEIRQIAEGSLETLAEFAASSRLHTTDAKGDTPLHLAARTGILSVCDLFIRSGADPSALNLDRKTPADLALSEGHGLVAQLLSSLVTDTPNSEILSEHDEVPEIRAAVSQEKEQVEKTENLDDFLAFEAEAEPEDFFNLNAGDTVSGTFRALVASSPVGSGTEDGDWDLDLSVAPIAGEGIGSSAATTTDHDKENDFLKVRNRGRQSIKRTVVQTSTRMSITPELCISWADEIATKGWCSIDDIDRLIADCEGNGDLDELRANLQRNLETAGFDLDYTTEHDTALWSAASDTTSEDLAEAIEAALTRRTRLPGTQRFVMDKSSELQLLEPMMRANQELQLAILGSETAIQTILATIDEIRDGSRNPASVSLKTIIPARPGHTETSEVFAAADTLRSWHSTGRVMDGKRRREALAALEALDLSRMFHNELVRTLEQVPACDAEANQLKKELLASERTTEDLVLKHLPYVRRFASRNVEEGEEPEDVFQVAFLGLQRSTRRFDPERGYRFLIYASYWMRQAITRWRSDEGATIRIPVHRNEKITALDRALERLDVRVGGEISDLELAKELDWTTEEIRQFRSIPREAEIPESLNDWDNLMPNASEIDAFDQAETVVIVADALADLPPRQADVIRMRFGIGIESDMTLEEIGQIYGVTRERIRQIEAKALDRLSHPGRKRRLQDLLGYDSSRFPRVASLQDIEEDATSKIDENKKRIREIEAKGSSKALHRSQERQRENSSDTDSKCRRKVSTVQTKKEDSPSKKDQKTKRHMSWTTYRTARLKELWAAGMSASDIAKKLGGTSRNAVIGKLNRLGLTDSNRGQLH